MTRNQRNRTNGLGAAQGALVAFVLCLAVYAVIGLLIVVL